MDVVTSVAVHGAPRRAGVTTSRSPSDGPVPDARRRRSALTNASGLADAAVARRAWWSASSVVNAPPSEPSRHGDVARSRCAARAASGRPRGGERRGARAGGHADQGVRGPAAAVGGMHEELEAAVATSHVPGSGRDGDRRRQRARARRSRSAAAARQRRPTVATPRAHAPSPSSATRGLGSARPRRQDHRRAVVVVPSAAAEMRPRTANETSSTPSTKAATSAADTIASTKPCHSPPKNP